MVHILYFIDLDCELTDKVEFIKFNPPENSMCKVDIKIYKFGVGVIDFIFNEELFFKQNIHKIKLSKRLTLIKFAKTIEKYIFKVIQPFKIRLYGQKYDDEFFYSVKIINEEKTQILKNSAQITEENLDILKLALSQYWNLLSYDVFLNKEVDSAINILNRVKIGFNFYKIIKNYFLLFEEGKEFHRDKLNIVNSLYRLMKDSTYSNDPESMEFYNKCKDVMLVNDLEKSVMSKIEKVSETYSFLGDSISTLFFIFFNIIFLFWALWGIIDTFLLWRLGK